MKRTWIFALLLLFWIALNNAAWYRAYHKPAKHHDYGIMPQGTDFEVGIFCTNQGDPAVEGNFNGMLVVSCGEQP